MNRTQWLDKAISILRVMAEDDDRHRVPGRTAAKQALVQLEAAKAKAAELDAENPKDRPCPYCSGPREEPA